MVDAGSVPFVVAGVASLALVPPVLWAGFGRAPNRALALFLSVYGALNLCVAAFFSAPTHAAQAYWYAVAWYFGLADAVALAWLMVVYPRPRAPAWARKGWPYVGLMLALGVAYAAWRPRFFVYEGPAGGTTPLAYFAAVRQGPLLLVDHALDLLFPVAALLFARDALTGRAGAAWRSCLLLAAGLPLLFVFRQVNVFTALALGALPPPRDAVARAAAALDLVQLLLLAALAAYVLWGGRGAPEEVRRAAPRHLAAPAVVALAGALAAATGQIGFGTPIGVVAAGSAFLAGPLLVAYAVVRHQLVDVDLRIKRTISHGTLAAFFVAAYAVAAVAGAVFAGPAVAPYLGAAAAVLLLLAIVPLRRLADRVAHVAMPGVDASPEYLSLRRLEVYRSALEESLAADGTLPEGAERVLARLRRSLGVTDRDHAVLLVALRGGGDGTRGGLDWSTSGLVLGKYRVVGALREGAHGRTLLAEDALLRRKVVIKTLMRGAKAADQVVREARALAAVRHPNVVALHEAERVGDEGFLVMEHVEGGSLAERLARGPLAPDELRRVALGLLAALEAVHAAGIVHRDVKPANVLLTAEGEPKLADFGVAHLPDVAATAGGPDEATPGTLLYMSPEQARGNAATPRSDLYAAAATLYEARECRPYVERVDGESAFELRVRLARGQPFDRPLDAPEALRAWFARALHPQPSRRFASAAAMRRALEDALEGVTRRRSTRGSGPRR